MVKVRVRQDNAVELRGLECKCLPVQHPEVLVALKEAAIDQQVFAPVCDKGLRTGHGAGRAKET